MADNFHPIFLAVAYATVMQKAHDDGWSEQEEQTKFYAYPLISDLEFLFKISFQETLQGVKTQSIEMGLRKK